MNSPLSLWERTRVREIRVIRNDVVEGIPSSGLRSFSPRRRRENRSPQGEGKKTAPHSKGEITSPLPKLDSF